MLCWQIVFAYGALVIFFCIFLSIEGLKALVLRTPRIRRDVAPATDANGRERPCAMAGHSTIILLFRDARFFCLSLLLSIRLIRSRMCLLTARVYKIDVASNDSLLGKSTTGLTVPAGLAGFNVLCTVHSYYKGVAWEIRRSPPSEAAAQKLLLLLADRLHVV